MRSSCHADKPNICTQGCVLHVDTTKHVNHASVASVTQLAMLPIGCVSLLVSKVKLFSEVGDHFSLAV